MNKINLKEEAMCIFKGAIAEAPSVLKDIFWVLKMAPIVILFGLMIIALDPAIIQFIH